MNENKFANNIDRLDSWFSNFIDQLKVDHFLLQTKTASKEKESFYKALMEGDDNAFIGRARHLSSELFIKMIIVDYLTELRSKSLKPLKLALGLTESKILVWSVVNDDDNETEDALLLAEAATNNKYFEHGFYISSTILEKSDDLPVPSHYLTIIE